MGRRFACERGISIIYRGSGDKVPVPGSTDVFVLVSSTVSVQGSVGDVQALELDMVGQGSTIIGVEVDLRFGC